MATVRTVIKNAYRKAGITATGQALTSAQSATGLELLDETYRDLVSKGTLGSLTEVYTTAACEAKEFQRVYATGSGLSITYPVTVVDENDGQTRAPVDGAVIVVVGPGRTAAVRIYSAETATWEDITGLTLTSVAPLTAMYQSDVEALLAAKLADERGLPMGPILVAEVRSARYHLAVRGNRRSSVAKGSYM